MTDGNDYDRRSYLKKSGWGIFAGASLLNMSQGAIASSTHQSDNNVELDTKSAAEAGIKGEVESLLADRQFDKLDSLLKDHGVSHEISSKSFSSEVDTLNSHESTSDDISKDDFAKKNSDDITTFLAVVDTEEFDGKEWDIISAVLNWDLNYEKDNVYAPAPVDAASIYWESNVFGKVNGSTFGSGKQIMADPYSNQSDMVELESPNLGNSTEGLSWSVDDTKSSYPDQLPFPEGGRGAVQTELRRQNKSLGNIRMEFGHNYSIGGGGWDPSNISLNIGGPVSYSLPNLTYNWTLGEPKEI